MMRKTINMPVRHSEVHHQLGESALTCLKGGPHVDAPRVQTVVTKRESESFCVHKFIKLSLVFFPLVINKNLSAAKLNRITLKEIFAKKCCTKTPNEMFLKRPKAEPEFFFLDEASLLTNRLRTRILPTHSSSGSGSG